jgi:molecular chaperone GrpE (heat shock protein)
LTVVEERTSECGFKEDLDRKEFLLKDKIKNLDKRIEDLTSICELTQEDIDNIHKQNEDIEKNKQIIKEKTG